MAKHDLDDFEDLDLGLDDDMGFEDDERPSNDRKASIFSRARKYTKNHYKSKLDDRSERKRILKQALPGQYSSTVDFAVDLKDDLDSVKYEVRKEWEKHRGPFKRLLKTQEGLLRALRLKKLVEYANTEERSRYVEEEADQDEALTANLLGDFTKYRNSAADKEDRAELRVEQKEKEDEREYRTKSLTTQIRGTANLGSILKELRNQTAYQDQITFQYQRKNLEFNIRNYIESKKQTEILRTYKEESILELREIHKNTGLPEAVKINQSELTGQLLKEKMIGNVIGYFDGKTSTLRRRMVARVKDRLLELTRNVGSTIEGMLDTANQQQETGGGSLARLFGQMFIDSKLDKPYNYAVNKATGYVRNKLGANSKFATFGKGLDAILANAGTMGNEALITGKTGNKFLDGLSSFLGMSQAASVRSTRLRNSLSESLDTATYMDVKFKQTVERVIPGWLSLIHKETYLTRIGSKKDTDYKTRSWDWDKEDFDFDSNVKDRAFTKVFKKDNIEQFSIAMENLLRVYDPIAFLTSDARDELKSWIYNKIQSSRSPSYYNLMLEINTFKNKSVRTQLIKIANYAADIHEEDLEYAEEGLLSEGRLIMRRPRYAAWVKKAKPYIDELASKPLFNIDELLRVANTEQGKVFEEMGLVSRDASGNLDISVDYEKKVVRQLTSTDYKQISKLKDVDGIAYKNNRGRSEIRNQYEIETDAQGDAKDEWLHSEARLNDRAYAILQSLLTTDAVDARGKKANEAKIKNILAMLRYQSNDEIKAGKKDGRITTRAAGGMIPSFRSGGKIKAIKAYEGGSTGQGPVDKARLALVHGKEFVTDAATTEQNEDLLTLMNRYKAPVFLPGGKVNPIYYKALGYQSEEEFRKNEAKQLRLVKKKERSDKFVQATNSGSAWLANKVKAIENSDSSKTKEKIKVVASEVSEEGKRIFDEAYKSLKGMSEAQLVSVYNKLVNTTDNSIYTQNEQSILASEATTHKKVLTVIKAKLREENRTKIVAELGKALGSQFYMKTKARLKAFLNGGTENTATTDNLKEVYGFGKRKVTGAYNDIKGFAENQLNKTALKQRYNQARDVLGKVWKDQPIDIFLVANPSSARLTAAGFIAGSYIDKASGKVLESHHDIMGEVISVEGKTLVTEDELMKGFLDAEGNRINPSTLARYRNVARNKTVELYNKYAKKHVDRYLTKTADVLLSATERWQRLTQKTAIDIWVTGGSKEPVLTEVGFKAGQYFSANTKKPLRDYLDIDGPVISSNGTYLLKTEDLDKLVDDKGKPVKPTKLKTLGRRLLSTVSNALGLGLIKSAGTKAWGKIKNFNAKRTALEFNKAGANAVDVYLTGQLDAPILYEKDFKAGLYVDHATGKKIANHYMIKGPVSKLNEDGTTTVVLSQPDLEKGFVDSQGKPLPVVKADVLRKSFFKGIGLAASSRFNKLKAKLKAKQGKNKTDESEGSDDESEGGNPFWGRVGKFKNKVSGKLGEKLNNLREGSWQWKRKKKEEDGWMSRFANALGVGKKKKEDGSADKPSWLKTIFGWFGKRFLFMGAAAAALVSSLGQKINIGSMVAGMAAIKASTMALKSLVYKPLMNLIPWLGMKIIGAVRGRGMMGNGIGGLGRVARIGGAALGAAAVYQGLKGQEQFDANGDPILDAEGKPVVERDYMGAALGAAGMAAMVPGVASGVMSAGAALLTNPVGWAVLGGAAAAAGGYWLGKKAFGWLKKGAALKENPLTSFRMIQYGFSPIDEKVVMPIMQLESYLSSVIVSSNDGLNISNQVSPDTVFGFFGLKYGSGDAERNKSFLAWFLGRFKPIYLSYAKQMNAIKKTYKLDTIDTSVSASDRLQILENVHFKSQSDMNPYNVPLSPFDDPNKTDYDFDDVTAKYEEVKEILKGMVPASEKPKEGVAKKEEEKSGVVGTAVKAVATTGVVGLAVNSLKLVSRGLSEVFGINMTGMKSKFDDMLGKTYDSVAKRITDFTQWASGVAAGVTSGAKNLGSSIATGASNFVGNVGEAFSATGDWISQVGKGGKTEQTLIETAKKAGITDPEEIAMLLAQASHESGGFKWSREYGNDNYFKKYDNRRDLGNGPNDGARYKGRGWIQLTGKANYAAFSKWSGVDVVSKPELLEKEPYASMATIWYWTQHPNMTRFGRAAAQAGDVVKTTKAVNGGTNGLSDRKQKYAKYIQLTKSGELGKMAASGAGTAIPPTIAKPGVASGQAAAIVNNATNKVASSGGNSPAPMIGIGGTDPTKSASKASAAATGSKGNTGNAGLAKYLGMVTPDLIAKGKAHCSIASNTTMNGMNENVANLFYSMIGDAVAKGCPKIHIREGVRTLAEQQRLWDRYQAYRRGQGPKAPAAAEPGTSRHGFGFAIDINPEPSVSWLVKNGYLEKWGFERNLLRSLGEWWHIEHKLLKPKGTPAPKIPAPSQADKKQAKATQQTNATAPATTASSGGSANTVSPSLNAAMNNGGFSSTNTVVNQQQADVMSNTATNNILTQQLSVQTQIRDALTELKDFIVKPQSMEERKRLDELKQPLDAQSVGEQIGKHLSSILTDKLSGGPKSHLDLQKPRAPISVSKF